MVKIVIVSFENRQFVRIRKIVIVSPKIDKIVKSVVIVSLKTVMVSSMIVNQVFEDAQDR